MRFLLILSMLAIAPGPAFCLESMDDNGLGRINSPESIVRAKCEPVEERDLTAQGMLYSSVRPAELIRGVFQKNAWALSMIYESEKTDKPCLHGMLRLRIVTDEYGHVVDVSYGGSNDEILSVADRMVAAVKSFRFGAASRRDEFDYLLNFNSK